MSRKRLLYQAATAAHILAFSSVANATGWAKILLSVGSDCKERKPCGLDDRSYCFADGAAFSEYTNC
jgi:hypothetical protein